MSLSKKNPTNQKSWSSLEKLYNQENNLHINDYFKSEKNRLEKFTASFDDLYVDFSKLLLLTIIISTLQPGGLYKMELIHFSRILTLSFVGIIKERTKFLGIG